jgi:hypothetical protein
MEYYLITAELLEVGLLLTGIISGTAWGYALAGAV